MVVIANLRCEHLEDPLGIETLSPRLSWRLETERRAARQTAYRINVATDPDLLAQGAGDLWDSGKVRSDVSVLVPYAGKKLRSRQRCWWNVHVWDETGYEAVSEPACWEMGLLDAADWKAQWIAGDTPKRYHDSHAAPCFRKRFHLHKKVWRARAYVSGLGFYEFRLNGRKVDDAVLHPAFTKYDARVLYTVHDISEYLVQGDNAAGIMLGTGWYDHHARDVWQLFAAPWRDVCKALVQIEITFADGDTATVCSDTSWAYSTGPIVFDGLRNGEIYDAREEQNGWDAPSFNPASWKPAAIARPPGGVLRAQRMPHCRVTETIRPISLRQIRPDVWLYDMGRNIAGWARLTVAGPAGTTVVMQYAEKLGANGDIDRSNLSAMVKTDVFQTDTYILKGDGIETYEARFVYHGFQYVQVTGLPGAAGINTIEGRVVHTDLDRIGSFECSKVRFNDIQQAAIASTVGNYHGIPTDCPHREKNGWTCDAHLSAEQVLYNFEPTVAYAKWLDDFEDCQRPSGAFPGIVPTGGWGYNWGAGPAWDSAFLLIPWYLYLYRGDREILRRHYDGMKQYIHFLERLATNHIVQFGLGDWCPPSGGPGDHKAPAELTNTAYYYADTRLVARIAALLGKKGDARRFETLAKKIRTAACKRFYHEASNRLEGHSQTAIACFLYQGLVDAEALEAFETMLLDEIAACNDHIDCGILGTKYVLNVLTDLDHADVACRIAGQRDYPGWGFWLEQGATTLWENWNGTASRNHHMFSDISAWFYKTLAGIRPDPEHPGFKHVIIKPCPVRGLTYAVGETVTPYGRLRSAWRKANGRFVLELHVPPNSCATVHLPADNPSDVLESGHAARSAEHVCFTGIERGRAVYAIRAGRYRFESAWSENCVSNQGDTSYG